MPSVDLTNIDMGLLNDTLTMCFSVFIWRSHTNVLALKNISNDYRHSILLLESSFKSSPATDPIHPGMNVSVEYYVQLVGGWFHVFSENTSLPVWKYSCVSFNFLTEMVTFSTGSFFKEIKRIEVKRAKAELLNNWERNHLWTKAETVSQINVFTTPVDKIKCGDIGNLISWRAPYWSFQNRYSQLAKRTANDDNVCGEAPILYIVNIPLGPTFWGAVSKCKLLGDGQVTAYYSREDWDKAFKKANKDMGSTTYLWFSIVKDNGRFVSFYTREEVHVNNIIWRLGGPERNQTCMYCQDIGCSDRSCESKNHEARFQCAFKHMPTLFLRGLCDETKLSRKYYPANRMQTFMWIGLDGTLIFYNISSDVWNVKGSNQRTSATIEASLDSLLLGTHNWKIYNDLSCFPGPPRLVKLNLSYCNNTMFNCDDGSCVSLHKRCDEHPDCNDGSDEVGCNIVSYHDNYNKEVTSNNEKSDLNTSVEIHNILSIDENRGKIRVTMRLILEWYDSRLTFMNLKIQKEFNVLSDSEYSLIWKPRVIYVNMETKDTEESLPPQITIHLNKLDTFSLANYNSLYSSRLYNGSNITIHWNRDFR